MQCTQYVYYTLSGNINFHYEMMIFFTLQAPYNGGDGTVEQL